MRIFEENKLNIPSMEGKQFIHKNGLIYTVLFLTNQDADPKNSEKYTVNVVYIGQNGKKWSRPLSTWHQSFKLYDVNSNQV